MSDPSKIRSHYARLLEEHGDSPQALDWGSAESQRRRFEVLCEALPSLGGLYVADIGCGLGHLADFLDQRYQGVKYLGVDATPELLAAAARRREGHGGDRYLCVDIAQAALGRVTGFRELDSTSLPMADVVIASGLLSETDIHTAMKMIRWMWLRTGRVLAFNVQTFVPANCSQLHFEPLLLADLAQNLTKRYVIRHDYAPHDATVYLYRHEESGMWTTPMWGGD